MYKLDIESLLPYFEVSRNFWNARVAGSNNHTVFEDLLKEKDRVIRDAVNDYVRDLEVHKNYSPLYFQDVIYAIQVENLYLLEMLIMARCAIPDLQFEKTDMSILKFLTAYFKKSDDITNVGLAKYLFEQILDTADNECEDYGIIIQNLVELNKDISWYFDFRDQIIKLLYRAPINNQVLSATKKLRSCVPDNIKIDVDEYLEDKHG
jgi:hypothetical protein